MSTVSPADDPTGTQEHVLHRICDELAASFDGVFCPGLAERYVLEFEEREDKVVLGRGVVVDQGFEG